MKKRNLNSLKLNKNYVANLEDTNAVKGGTIRFTKGGCVSIKISCITQTEHPTCRNCE